MKRDLVYWMTYGASNKHSPTRNDKPRSCGKQGFLVFSFYVSGNESETDVKRKLGPNNY